MSAKWEKTEKNKGELTFEINNESIQKGLDIAFKRIRKKLNVPGFRKGKISRQLFNHMYGEESLYEDALNAILPDEYENAINDVKIDPVDQPVIHIEKMEKGSPWIIKAVVTVKPDVKLGKYKGLSVTKQNRKVLAKDVNAEINKLRNQQAELVLKKGKAQKGDTVTIDYVGYIDGKEFKGGKANNYSLELGSGTFIPGFEDQLVGHKADDDVDVNVKFPENYSSKEIAGKDALFKVKIHEVREKHLPKLDDEFAKEVSEFNTLDELKADIKGKIEETKKASLEREYEDALITAVIENSKMEVPGVMVEKEIDNMVRDLENRLKYQGLSLEQYMQFTGSTEEKMRAYMKENADKKVKADLVLEAIAKAEKIEATEEEVKEKATEIAKMYAGDEAEKMAEMLMQTQKAMIERDIVIAKTIKLLEDNCK